MSSDSTNSAELGNFKMFEFVRIKNVKSSEAKSLQANIDSKDLNLELESQFIHGVPKKRSGHRAVCNNENMWIWGGYCPVEEALDPEEGENQSERFRNPLFPELWRFNFSTRRWCLLETTGTIPSKLVASHSAVLYGTSTLIVFGGTGFPFGLNLSNSLYTCNLNTLVWKMYELKGEVPLALYGSSLLVIDDYLYILFGTNAREYCSNVYRINIKTLESVKLFDSIQLLDSANFFDLQRFSQEYPDDFLNGRYRQEVVHYQGELYTFGGGKIDGDAHSLQILPVFSLKTNKWQFRPTQADSMTNTYPERRKFHSCILVNEYVFVFGGMYCNLEENQFRSVENAVWRLSLKTMQWQKLNIQIPCLTYFHAACANENGQVYLHGGVKTIDHERTSRINHLYTILLKIPKLTDICWTKLITNYPKLLYLNKSKLHDIGIPSQFINRIN